MHKKRRTKTSSQSNEVKDIIIKSLIGSAFGTIFFLILTALASLILWKQDADTPVYKYVLLLIGAVSGFLTGFIAVRPVRKNGLAVGGLSALPSYFIVILTSSILARSGVGVIGWILLAVMVIFSAVGGIVAVNKR